MTDHRHRTEPQDKQAHRRLPITALLATIAVLALFAAACGGSIDDAADSATSDAAFEAPASAGGLYASGDAEVASEGGEAFDGDFDAAEAPTEPLAQSRDGVTTTGAAGSEITAQLPDLGRDIIFTASLEIASSDVSTATRDAIRAIEARGGFLFSQETSGGPGGSSVLTFKVLPDQFQAALNDLGAVGDVRSQSISADDVSAVVVDLESRINTAEASVIRLRDLLDDADELETIATLENQLLQRETTLEQLRGQLRTVRSQVDLATITVYVTELLNRPGVALETMAFAGHDGGFSCFDTAGVRRVEQGDAVTVCYRLTNTGDTPLVDIDFDDPVLGAAIGSLVVVDGSVTQIEPGESTTFAHEVEIEETLRLRTSVTATGLDIEGNEIDEEIKATAATLRFDVEIEEDGTPGFGEVLGNSWDALVTAAVVIALVAVAAAPFVAVALVLGLPLWWLLRRRRTDAGSVSPAAPPAPPAASVKSPELETDDPGDAVSTEKASTTS